MLQQILLLGIRVIFHEELTLQVNRETWGVRGETVKGTAKNSAVSSTSLARRMIRIITID